MKLAIPYGDLTALVASQINNFFVLKDQHEKVILEQCIGTALERCEYCFSFSLNKYYNLDGTTLFNPFHSGQYSIFLYFLSNSIHREYQELRLLADKVYYLNKALNGLDLYYEVDMPEIFFLDHPVGSVIGKATYADFFSFRQSCTVGNNRGVFPVMGKNVMLMSGAKVLGDCTISENVIVAANTYIKDTDIPPSSVVFGSSPDLVIKRKDESYFLSTGLMGFKYS